MLFVYCEKSVIHPHPAFGHLLPHREKEMGGGTVCSVFSVFGTPLGQALGLDSCCWFWVCRLVGALRGQECLRSFGQARQKPRWARREFQKYPLPWGRGQGEGGNGGVEMPFVHCEKSVIHPHPAFGHLLPHREKEMGGGSV